MKNNLIEETRLAAVNALKHCVKKTGIYASGTPEGYQAVFARDAIISLLGGALIDQKFKPAFKKSLITLSKNQAPNGQIPNAVGIYDPNYQSKITYNTIDSSLWFIIGCHIYEKTYKEALPPKIKKSAENAFVWITYQDYSEEHLPAQLPTTDWQDAFPHKYGHTINTESLYYAVLLMTGKNREAKIVKDLVAGNKRPHLKLWDENRGYFLPWAWKDHDGDREEERWFDSLGNCLAILTGLASPAQSKKILRFIEKENINLPYPMKTIFPPIRPLSQLWKTYFEKSDAREPYHYLNGGVWPFIGGFYVAALVKTKQLKKARLALEKLAASNKIGRDREFEFNEWLDGRTGKPLGGIYQAWSIGMFLYAHECVKTRKVPFF